MTDHDDAILRAALRAEAGDATADDELLDRIHRASSPARPAWTVRAPWLLAVAALAVVVGLAAAVLAQGDDDETLDVVDDASTTTTIGQAPVPVPRPTQAVALTPQGRIVVVDTATGEVIRDLGGFDDPTDPAIADREGGAYSITGVALHPNGQEVYFETCCEPASGAVFRVPVDGSVQIDVANLVPVAFGYGIDISGDGRWLGYVNGAGLTLLDLDSGDAVSAPTTPESTDLVQAAVNGDGTEVTAERALERSVDRQDFRILRSELITFRRVDSVLSQVAITGGDTRLLPTYANGELAQVATRDGVIDVNVDASGQWFLATPAERSLRGYTRTDDEREIPGGPYVAADW